jgi:S-adenosylmethionine:tRNA ribosyltransferase-isomerase
LLVVDRTDGSVAHSQTADLPNQLSAGDTLVINSTRVIKARLRAMRTNGREAEVLLVRETEDPASWLAMVHPGGKLKTGRTVTFGGVTATITDVLGGGLRRVTIDDAEQWPSIIEEFGSLPLPPYIEHAPTPEDDERYQTVFAREAGSVAAPTAGLHFTDQLLNTIRSTGVEIVELLLHVGPGTFRPVQTDRIADHQMHSEWYEVTPAAAETINHRRAAGGKTVAVGTTVTRVLETVADSSGVQAGSGWTDIFIRHGHQFKAVDALLTNFHLPRSTLLMLVCAFGGYDSIMTAYRAAIADRYRLFSYGDAMLIR